MKEYHVREGPKFSHSLMVVPAALLRFTNPVSGLGLEDGAFVVWQAKNGRPAVGAQVFFLTAEHIWIHECHELAPVALKTARGGDIIGEPNKPGVEVKPVPNAPMPAQRSLQRLVKMRQIANRLSVSDEFEGRPQSDKLRLMSDPLILRRRTH